MASSSWRGGKKWRRRRLGLMVGAVVLVLAAVTALVGMGSSSEAGEIPRGVEVGNVDIGGKSSEEAKRILSKRANAVDQVRVSEDGNEATISANSLGAKPDIEATVDNAMKVGREGNVFERFGDLGTNEVPLEVSYSEQAMHTQTEALANEIDQEPRQAAVEVSKSGADVTASAEGYEVNVDRTATNIREAMENMEGEAELEGIVVEPEVTTSEAEDAAERAEKAVAEPVTLGAGGEQWRLGLDQIAAAVNVESRDGELRVNMDLESLRGSLEEMYSSLNNPATEADYRFAGGGVEITPSETGQRIESQKLMDELESGLLGEGLLGVQREYEVSVAETKPDFTTERAEELKPTQKIGEYRTTFQNTGDDKPARVANLEIAGQALTGEMVAPGEVFSANDVLAGVDYNAASTFVNGAETDALGGGLCQVASTLYMAANYAGMEPVERHPHFALLNYIRPGFDATLWFGAENGYSGQELDMKFRNTSEGYVMIREYVADDGYLYAEVWGQPTGKEVTMNSMDQGTGSKSSSWTTTKTVENEGGKTGFDGTLHTNTYYALETDQGSVSPNQIDVAPVNP